MRRRSFLIASVSAPAAVVTSAGLAAAKVEEGDGPYGPLSDSPDAQGLLLPEGFSSRVLAVSGQAVEGTGFTWHTYPDGGATFAGDAGGWIYVSNSELGEGTSGVNAIAFDESGAIVDAYAIASGTTRNCAGGVTPWGTWLSCEEVERGRVWECDPTGATEAVERPALGLFVHEAACVDPDHEVVYLTEDAPDGRFYRFTPDNYPDLSAGLLEVAQAGSGGALTWLTVPDPSAASIATRLQVAESTAFVGGEGIWYRDGFVWFVTKGDHGLWQLDTEAQTIEQIYRGVDEEVVLGEPDNIVMTDTGDLYVCEDQAEDQQVVLITPEGIAAPVLQLTGHSGSELTGVAFDPSGTSMYVSSQRGGPDLLGITYEITGPFRRPAAPEPTTSTTAANVSGTTAAIATATSAAAGDAGGNGGSDDGVSPIVPIGIGGAIAAGLAFGAYRLRNRPRPQPPLE